VLDERHLRPAGSGERFTIAEITIDRRVSGDLLARHSQSLEHHRVTHPLGDDIEAEERVAQVIEHAHEQHEIPLFAGGSEIVHLHVPELDTIAQRELACRPIRLAKEQRLHIDTGDLRAAPRELEGVEARVAPDVQRTPPCQLRRQIGRDLRPLERRKIAERVVRCRLRSVRKVQVVEPRPERGDFLLALPRGR
jgi:hypothetical protein